MLRKMIRTCKLFVFLLVSFNAKAAVKQLSTCSVSDVQSAINSAVNGDTIKLPTCSVTWNSTINIPNSKGVTLDGNGSTVARGALDDKTPLIYVSPNSSTSTRITGFKFNDSKASYGYFITVSEGNENSAKFRIDHNSFTGMSMGTHILVSAPVYGVIDHNNLVWEGNNEVIHNEAYGADSNAGWLNDVVPGSGEALYIEDNNFQNKVSGDPAYFWGGSAVQGYYGSRTVFRYNHLDMAQVDMHGTPGMIGARWWEVYENTFNIIENGNQDKYINMRGGTGVIFNNHKTGFPNLGSGGIVMVEEDAGYPALYQVGCGKNQVLDPAYVWKNDAAMNVYSDSSNVAVNRDFYQSNKPGYKPYQYPHPLVSGNIGVAPAPAPTPGQTTTSTTTTTPTSPSQQTTPRLKKPKNHRMFNWDTFTSKRKKIFFK